jgi:serine acetyltransferase
VWIGEDVTILSGVTIGDGVCIGAGSIVTRDLEPYSICAGTPCRTIKKRYSEEVIRYLQELKWWDWSDDVIRVNRKFFHLNLNRASLPEIMATVSP